MPTVSMSIATSAISSSRSRSRIFREGAIAMATRLREVDAVVVGMGWTGSILARELTKAGLRVVGLERGPSRMPAEDFTLPGLRDELTHAVRHKLLQDAAQETVSMRHAGGETALPMRRLGAFHPGTGLGG